MLDACEEEDGCVDAWEEDACKGMGLLREAGQNHQRGAGHLQGIMVCLQLPCGQ